MNKMISKTVKWISALAAVALMFGSCSKDKDPGMLSLDSEALFLTEPGQTASLGFAAASIRSVSVTKEPAGWTVKADLATQTITVTAPADLSGSSKSVRSGTVSIIGYSYENNSIVKRLFISVSQTKDLTDRLSNSVIVPEPYTEYSFDATRKGETTETMPTADVRIIWQTDAKLIRYPAFKGGKFSFYVDDLQGVLAGGNALLGAYDGANQLLATWHLWVVDGAKVKEETYANGKVFMSLNLGALGNTHATNDEMLASYGLFYQWGRKEPFVGPYAYNAAKAQDQSMYDAEGNSVKLAYEASSSEKGTAAYASAHPLSYILGVEESGYDWLYAAHSDALWADRKTANDPCPKGWRVPSKDDFSGLQIADKAAGSVNRFGWNLTDGTATVYYPGAGFRPYLTGRIQNVYNPVSGVEVPMPWIGYYWTNGTDAARSSALYFWFDASDALQSGIEPAVAQYRANGMQIRCVKE